MSESLLCRIQELELCVAELKATPPATVPEDWRCEEVCAVVGYVTVSQAGDIAASCGEGIAVERTGVGTYQITAPIGAETHSIHAIEGFNSRDGVHIHFAESFTGLTVWIAQGDNGGTADTLVDRPFTIQWFGKRTMVVCENLTGTPPNGGGGFQTGTPANGDLVSDNFQDGAGNAPFNLQVRNTTNSATGWQACTPNVPYATIPGLVAGAYTHDIIDNGDGTYVHCFTGTSSLGAFAATTITGGLPVPAGSGGVIELYVP